MMSKLLLLYACLVGFTSMVSALPLTRDIAVLDRRMPQRMIIGFRAVRKEIAEEYNKAGTLTNVLASGIQTGEGAYLTASPGEYVGVPPTYWHCVVYADPAIIENTHKLWIPEHNAQKHPLFFKANEKELRAYILAHHMQPDEALLFSWIEGHKPPVRQMLIPPIYLLGNNGHRSLGISVKCVPPEEAKVLPAISAPWSLWKVPGFEQLK